MNKEHVVVDPKTGGRKGQKAERFDLIPYDALRTIARVYNYGAQKYEDPHVGANNWRRGYAWSLSFAALMRHLTAWWEGEEMDPESGHSHLAHAGWHVLTLIWFTLTGRGTDDRPAKLFPSKGNPEKPHLARVLAGFYGLYGDDVVNPNSEPPKSKLTVARALELFDDVRAKYSNPTEQTILKNRLEK